MSSEEPKPINTGTQRDGQLDEHLKAFWTEAADNQGAMCFQFETGGFKMVFRAGMTMTEMADKFAEAEHRMRGYKVNGWPVIKGAH